MLTVLGYNVMLTEDGEAAVAFYQEHLKSIDLVILDIVMAKISGQETLRQL